MSEQFDERRFLLTVDALVNVHVRGDGLVELELEGAGGADPVTATLEPEAAFDLHRMLLEAAIAAARRGESPASELKAARIRVIQDRMRWGVATGEDAEELCALMEGRIEEIEMTGGLVATAEEEEG